MGTMSYSNRELVEYFIIYKLSQRNYPASLLRPDDAAKTGEKTSASAANGLLASSRRGNGDPEMSTHSPCEGIEAVKVALRDSAEEFELRFTLAFSDLSSQLDVTLDTAYHSFKSVMDELFKDGVNWGRIVGLFAFGGVLCVECVEKNMSELVSRVADWMTLYLDEHISPWIQSQGGWDRFAEIFGRDAAAEARGSQETLKRWLLFGVVLLTGVLLGVVIAKRR
ncbi:bcl-2-like protein 1 [Betta splendens]|uniref:Bcl-2-like protein 1 n=1 Tax=Betta splendens TaxID=158456 RepID=A0A6P7MKR1_BETSP|nr:bcl-2-like protein 1 [Betta splendens]XP_055365292.1 bcl-2-like protein 1 [Betta splendens]